MTKEESIKVLTQYIDYDAETPDYYEMEKACKVAIKALEQEPCEDCISREEVCDYIAEFVNHEYATDREREMVKNIIGGIQHLSSIQPKTGHWIPVSERLPENHDDVLVWFEYIKGDWDCAWWGFAYYSLQYKKWVVSTNERNPIVKAWMPLPKPYTAEKE